jgi:hypothetical protein
VFGGFDAAYSVGAYLCHAPRLSDGLGAAELPGVVNPEDVVLNRNLAENQKASQTEGYTADGSLVVRRNAPFTLIVDPVRIVPKSWRFKLLNVSGLSPGANPSRPI